MPISFPASPTSSQLYTYGGRTYRWTGTAWEFVAASGSGGSSAVRTFAVTNSGSGAYLINGASNPTLTLERGQTYDFVVNAAGHPFHLQTVAPPYSSGNLYTTGVTGSGTASGTIRIVVPYDAPSTLYYVCQFHGSMGGTINVVNANEDLFLRSFFTPGSPTGVTATAGNAQASVSWTAPTGVIAQAPITDYVVQFSSNSGSSWSTFSDGTSTATSATVTGLTDGTAYVFRVAAVNGVGVGAFTAASAAVTPAAFAPTSIAGLQLWLDASDASTLFDATSGGSLVAADGAVARWEDKSGNARHATQATSGSRPLRKAAVQGGRDVLRADGASHFMQTTAFSSNLVRSVFMVAISRQTPQADTYACILGQIDGNFGGGDADPWAIGVTDAGTGSLHNCLRAAIRNAANDGFIQGLVNTAFVTGMPFLASYINNGTGVFRFGSTAAPFPTAGLHTTFTKRVSVFSQANDDATELTNFWNGDIAELIIYNSALSDANRSAVESYLMSKWGIT